jgi:hypothetical protein
MQVGPATCAGPFLLVARKGQLAWQKIEPCYSDSARFAEPVLSEAERRAEESQSPRKPGESHVQAPWVAHPSAPSRARVGFRDADSGRARHDVRPDSLHEPERSKSQEVQSRRFPPLHRSARVGTRDHSSSSRRKYRLSKWCATLPPKSLP